MTTSPIKRDNENPKKLLTEIRTSIAPFLPGFRDEKLYCISQVR